MTPFVRVERACGDELPTPATPDTQGATRTLQSSQGTVPVPALERVKGNNI